MIQKSKKLSFRAKIIIAFSVVFIMLLSITFYNYYLKFFGPNVTGEQEYLYIPTGSDFDGVFKTVKDQRIVKDSTTFLSSAENMDYREIKPGKYKLTKGMSNRKLINMLKAGNQEPVKLGFQNIRLKENFAGLVSKKIEADSASIIKLMDSAKFVQNMGFDINSVYTMFIPNSYELYWNTSAEKFFTRMYTEYQKFWNSERKAAAEKIGLKPIEVSILASIVDGEALHDQEMPAIAGLYMNRLNKGMRLEADPTVIFANNDFSIRRVLNKHLRKESPYNTYLNKGLPPGPISMPSIRAIDAVLNFSTHNYIYMCAKEDFSGYHAFASTLTQHLVNAKKFQQALNDRNIKK